MSLLTVSSDLSLTSLQLASWQPENKDIELRYGVWQVADAPETAPVVVFFPGLGGSVKHALGFFNTLKPYTRALLVPDLQGFGLNEELSLPRVPQAHAQHALAFLQQVALPLAEKVQRPIVVGGISLGVVVQTAMLLELQKRLQHVPIVGQCWVAPAFQPHPVHFGWQTQLKTGVQVGHQWIQRQPRLCPLPYGLQALTRHPWVLADPQQHHTMENFILPTRFLWGIRQLSRQIRPKLSSLCLPTWLAIPGQDVVCHPEAMAQAYRQLPPNSAHQLSIWPAMHHNMLIEPEHGGLAKCLGLWLNNFEKKQRI